jgi:hypothetical protein
MTLHSFWHRETRDAPSTKSTTRSLLLQAGISDGRTHSTKPDRCLLRPTPLYAFGHPIGLHDSAEEALDWLLTVKAIAAVSPFFKQYPYVAQWLLPCPEWLVKILYPVFAPSIRLHGVNIFPP